MKMFNKLLALCCVLYPNVWGAAAFSLQPSPRVLTFNGRATNSQSRTISNPLYSTPGGQQGDIQVTSDMPSGGPSVTGGGLQKNAGNAQLAKSIWDTLSPVKVQGGSLKTWSFSNHNIERVQVLLKTEGRPLNANVDLWQGPDNTPQKMGIYIEDGSLRPFSAVIETPRGPNAIAIRNISPMEFPLAACVEADVEDSSAGLAAVIQSLADMSVPETIQGGSLKTYSFAPSVASVQILLKTDGRPLNARIELLQGPNNNKQVMEVYTEDGLERPFYAVIESPGSGNVVRVINTAPIEFPLTARVEPYMVEEEDEGGVIISDGGPRW